MDAYVGVTDSDWYQYLAARPEINEVNFWRPGGPRVFGRIDPGEPFFFKTHAPHNRVVGGAILSGFVALRVSEAWEYFGPGNGVGSLREMRQRIGWYRKSPLSPLDDPEIGCILLRDARFFPPGLDVAPPSDFASSIVQGKGYELSGPAEEYFGVLLSRLLDDVEGVAADFSWSRPGPVYGDPRLVPQRLGQQAFQAVILSKYGRRCAVTGGHIRPVLQAAHIRPLPLGGEHRVDNGLLLRSDVHTLFDRGYLSVDPQYRLLVSPRLRDEFGNGEEFYSRAGTQIGLPERKADRPDVQVLEWHADAVFKRG